MTGSLAHTVAGPNEQREPHPRPVASTPTALPAPVRNNPFVTGSTPVLAQDPNLDGAKWRGQAPGRVLVHSFTHCWAAELAPGEKRSRGSST
ncbi:hypothetical protein PLICRDRAFT_43674 [Plicaturopsis crispa FD-325 SS-3]|nr:hypothetical protein PLICRDRAFT_43674 [Plicaturopsis crispa FD-325 SS-3]